MRNSRTSLLLKPNNSSLLAHVRPFLLILSSLYKISIMLVRLSKVALNLRPQEYHAILIWYTQPGKYGAGFRQLSSLLLR